MLRLTIVLLCLSTVDALALKRIDVSNKSCKQIKAILETEGKALLLLPSKRVAGLPKYGLYVDGQRSCHAPEIAAQRRIGSKTGTCFVYQCVDNGHGVVL